LGIQVFQNIFQRPAWFVRPSFEQKAILQVFAQLLIRNQESKYALTLGIGHRLDFGY
jgi:hypothetical protein